MKNPARLSRLSLSLLFSAILLMAGCASKALRIAYNENWTEVKGDQREQGRTITRITSFDDGSLIRFENDFELYLFDTKKGTMMAVSRERQQKETEPIPRLAICPVSHRLRCELRDRDANREIECSSLPPGPIPNSGGLMPLNPAPEETWTHHWKVSGNKRPPDRGLMIALEALEVIEPELACMLKELELDPSEIHLRGSRKATKRTSALDYTLKLERRGREQIPHSEALFEPPF